MFTYHGKWSPEENDTVFVLADQGMSTMQIAMKMQRTQNAVAWRIRMRKRFFDARRPAVRQRHPIATIAKADVPDFFALGWRLASFEGGTIVFEWPHGGTPMYPQRAVAA